jgi:SAM-dependent methyltransferase
MTIEASLIWQSRHASHCDRLLVADSALLADGRWARAAAEVRGVDGVETVNNASVELDAAPWLQPAGQPIAEIPISEFRLATAFPTPGRFYPRSAFRSLAQNPRDMRATRLLKATEDTLRVDANHPLAACGAKLSFSNQPNEPTRGVRMAGLFDGPGMQVPAESVAMTYLQPHGLLRQDAASDAVFYARPRLTHHLDAVCRAEISALYGRFLKPGQRVLDFMSSWVSHLPVAPGDIQVSGLGMNAAELDANPRLSERVVQDLNLNAELPWPSAEFDVVLCTASIEYLLDPATVMAQVQRVLKPGGVFVVTFSDRWFPTKAIQVWSELHPFERLGMVLGLLRDAGFSALHSETRRGLKRPEDDKYIENRLYSDPLFAAWGVAPG